LALFIDAWVESPFMLAQPAASSVTKSALAALPTRRGTSGVGGLREGFLRSSFFMVMLSGSVDITARAMDA
jgi:hypothetical protein